MITSNHLLLVAFGGSIGLLAGFAIAWIVVDRDYNEHLQRLVRGEAHEPLRHSNILPKGTFHNFEA